MKRSLKNTVAADALRLKFKKRYRTMEDQYLSIKNINRLWARKLLSVYPLDKLYTLKTFTWIRKYLNCFGESPIEIT